MMRGVCVVSAWCLCGVCVVYLSERALRDWLRGATGVTGGGTMIELGLARYPKLVST